MKTCDPRADDIHIVENISQQARMTKVFSLVERSAGSAVAHSDILSKRGVVNVGNIKEVKPDDAGK